MPIDTKTANDRTKIPALGDIKIMHSKSKKTKLKPSNHFLCRLFGIESCQDI